MRFCDTSRAKSSFSAGILNTIEKVRSRIAKVTCFTVENGPPSRPPRKWQHYRGFDHLGRWGPQSGRPGHRPPGKIRYFRNDLCSFPGREAGSVSGAHNPIGEATSRMAAGTVIYVRSGEVVFQFLQHSRRSDVPDRGRDGDLRCIRRRRP